MNQFSFLCQTRVRFRRERFGTPRGQQAIVPNLVEIYFFRHSIQKGKHEHQDRQILRSNRILHNGKFLEYILVHPDSQNLA